MAEVGPPGLFILGVGLKVQGLHKFMRDLGFMVQGSGV